MTLLLFAAKHAAVLALILAAAVGGGTLALRARIGIALRGVLGLALWAHTCFVLAIIGQLRPVPLAALALIALMGGAWRMRLTKSAAFADANMTPWQCAYVGP